MANTKRLETTALVLPVFGALLFVPPLLGVFNVPVTIFGIPVVAIYMFSVWLGLIGATIVLSRFLGRGDARSGGDSGEDAP
jgi:putative effector of murein hydrolase LrgA (UPF0299 family)